MILTSKSGMVGSLKSCHILLGMTSTGISCVTTRLTLDNEGFQKKIMQPFTTMFTRGTYYMTTQIPFHGIIGHLAEQKKVQLTSSAAIVRQGQCFLVSLTLTALAHCAVFKALDRLSGATSRHISLASGDTPSI